MKKIDFPLLADVAFYAMAVWFLSMGILRYFRIKFATAAILASLFALAAGGAVFLVGYFGHRKRQLGKKQSEARDALLLHLALEKENEVLKALLAAFLKDGKKAELLGECLVTEDGIYIPRFTMQPLSADELARLIRANGKEEFTLLCNALSPEAERLRVSFGIKVWKSDEIYALFTRTETTPSPLIPDAFPKKTAKRAMRRIFSKKSARPFFTSGILLLFMSLFTFFPIYYLISGSVLTLLAIFVRFFGFTAQNA